MFVFNIKGRFIGKLLWGGSLAPRTEAREATTVKGRGGEGKRALVQREEEALEEEEKKKEEEEEEEENYFTGFKSTAFKK